MSLVARSTRTAARTISRTRPYSVVVDAPSAEWVAKREAIKHHAAGTTALWRRICFFVCVPGTVAVIAWVRNVEAEHAEHQEHLKRENDGHLPEVPGYDYLNKRVKPYPWGPNSLFFNPHVNKDMSD
ncbi:COX6A, subunit VIa of cytochrome c oxidase [Russula ochroleuca]|uniref:COX6A, subunit VIa of cytochrome c oxidase n=1 Tax=Russula ochroleuca TaxID=152965 RepID=A0A9P5MXW8_9AGAM|nr:COX6A, subunit VIa of cytochrome c oxidase [Russula ochroleuca]